MEMLHQAKIKIRDKAAAIGLSLYAEKSK